MKRLAILIAATAMSGTAFAADPIYTAPTPGPVMDLPPSVDWTGFYAGVQAGYGFGSTGVINISPFTPELQDAFAPGFGGNFDDGFVGGLHVGYDVQYDRLVFGGVLDVNYADIGDVQQAFSGTPATYTISRDIDYLINARLRAGYLVTDQILVYATGGLAYADVDFGYSQSAASIADFTLSGGQRRDIGYTVGGGVETLLGGNFSLGLEYLYTNLGGNDFEANLTNGPFGDGTSLTTSDRNFDFHTVQLRLSYRF